MAEPFLIQPTPVTLKEIQQVLEEGRRIELSSESRQLIQRCREYLDGKIGTANEPLYGINTGFGALYDRLVPPENLEKLQQNLVMSHACGMGETVPDEIVKLMLLLKVRSLAYGYSGVQVETVQRLIDFYNEGVLPVVYRYGSLGASGDLAPLAHLSLPLLGMGEVRYKGKVYQASDMCRKFGWEPVRLKRKDWLF
jgi:histidine ammonia-lyase